MSIGINSIHEINKKEMIKKNFKPLKMTFESICAQSYQLEKILILFFK